jgi:pSer/pThr/pTyr-binding forkhead associated (FHA) protein
MGRAAAPASTPVSAPVALPPAISGSVGAKTPSSPGLRGGALAPTAGRIPTARLISIQRGGVEGEVYSLFQEAVDFGRSEGAVTLPDDMFLAPRHARIEPRNGRHFLLPLDRINGVFVRIREAVELRDGDTILVGKEVLRIDVVPDFEREPMPAIEHGVTLFGTPQRRAWARLRQLMTSGAARDIYHLSRNEVVLGREEGELIFADDEFMSRRHAQLLRQDGRIQIVDLGSSNGTYVRVRTEVELRTGDYVRMGDQLLRFESLAGVRSG